MHPLVRDLCTAVDLLNMAECAFAAGKPVDVDDFMRRKREVLTAAKAARSVLEIQKIQPAKLTVQAEVFGYARGASDRARAEVFA